MTSPANTQWGVLIKSTDEPDRNERWQEPTFPLLFSTEAKAEAYTRSEVIRLLHQFIDDNNEWLLEQDRIDTRMYDEVEVGKFRLNAKYVKMSLKELEVETSGVMVDPNGGWGTLWFKIKPMKVDAVETKPI